MYMFGDETSSELPEDFKKLRQELAENGSFFEDETFSPEVIALTKLKEKVVWKRPFEITDNPRFISEGPTRFNVDQGQLGDCWFLTAVTDLTLNQKLFQWVVPFDQDFTKTPNYAGIFLFRIWQYGRWEDIVIDDRLPTIDNELVYLRSADWNEYWPALLEKAYAKLYGSYKNIEIGQTTEALQDLCGGFSKYYRADDPNIFKTMSVQRQRSSFVCSSISSSERENRRSDGLIADHAYSVISLWTTVVDDSYIELIRLRNPWGNNAEWNGDWSDRSSCWNSISEFKKEELLDRKPDGEFWMKIEDFQKCFTFVQICHLEPSSVVVCQEQYWSLSMFEGSWERGSTAGGGYAHKDTTFACNPQYFFSIRGDGSREAYAVVIELMQKDRRLHDKPELNLELDIFRVQPEQEQDLDKSFFKSNEPVFKWEEDRLRQLTVDVKLPPGKYCIIPCTCDKNEDANYFLRMYFEVDANVTFKKIEPDGTWGCHII